MTMVGSREIVAERKSTSGIIPTAPPGYSIAFKNMMKMKNEIIMVIKTAPKFLRTFFK
jgi:hypothetical protein